MEMFLWFKLVKFLFEFFDIYVEVFINDGFIDIVGEYFDVGVRLGELISKDMIVVCIGLDWCFVVVGMFDYFVWRLLLEYLSDLINY